MARHTRSSMHHRTVSGSEAQESSSRQRGKLSDPESEHTSVNIPPSSSQTPDTSNEATRLKGSAKSLDGIRRLFVSTLFESVTLAIAVLVVIVDLFTVKLQHWAVWSLYPWKWGIMVIVVICGRPVTAGVIIMIAILAEKDYLMRKKEFYFFYGTIGKFRICAWLTLVATAWYFVFHTVERSTKVMSNLDFVSRLLFSLWVASVFWLAKAVTVKLAAMFYHSEAFFDRIQESIFRQYVLQELSGQSMTESEKGSRRLTFMSMWASEVLGAVGVSKLHQLKRGKISPWMIKGLVKDIRNYRFLTIYDVIGNTISKELVPSVKEITTEIEAKAAAQRIFSNVAKSGERHMEQVDLLRYLTTNEVDVLLRQVMGASETKKIEKSAFDDWVVKAYREREVLVRLLNDSKTAVKQVDALMSVIVLVIIVVLFLLMMGFQTTTYYYAVMSSHLLIVSVYINEKCKTTFQSIMFVFVSRPFDVGDRCVIDKVQMTVEEINLVMTTFLTVDNLKIYYPNTMLSRKVIKKFVN